MSRPRFSSLFAVGWVLTAVLLAAAAVLLDVTARPPSGKTVVTVRLWDQQVAKAYRQSFAAFTRTHPDIEVQTNVISYSTYFNTLRTDVAGGSADDIFWLSNAYLAGYADSGRLLNIGRTFGAQVASTWESSVVQQFTRGGTLWGVPQLTDAGIALYYNADLLAAAGVDPASLTALRWSPDGGDTLRPLLARLTVDADGRTAAQQLTEIKSAQKASQSAPDYSGAVLDLKRSTSDQQPRVSTRASKPVPIGRADPLDRRGRRRWGVRTFVWLGFVLLPLIDAINSHRTGAEKAAATQRAWAFDGSVHETPARGISG